MKVILATDLKNGISKDGKIPWNKPEDMKYFKNMTTKTVFPNKINSVIMGRKTWETLPNKILPKRINIVITRNKLKYFNFGSNLVYFVESLDEALKLSKENEKIENNWIIGGAEIYNEAFKTNKVTDIFLTIINEDYNCDKHVKIPNMKEESRKIINDLTFIHFKN